MSDWVKFHRELTEGAKRGLKRGHRFVYMELSGKARAGRGTIELPIGMTDEAAVVDLLGGDAAEAKAAIRALSAGEDPMIRFYGEPGRRLLEVLSWSRWNAMPGESTERVKRHRAAHSNDGVTRYTPQAERVTDADVTEVKQGPSGDQSRVEKRREEREIPDKTPEGPPDAGASVDEPRPPSAADRVFATFVAGWVKAKGRGAKPKLTPERARMILARIKSHGLADVEAAAAGCWLDPFHRGEGFAAIKPELVFRNAGYIEKFSAFALPEPEREHYVEPEPPPMRRPPVADTQPAQSIDELLAIAGGTNA